MEKISLKDIQKHSWICFITSALCLRIANESNSKIANIFLATFLIASILVFITHVPESEQWLQSIKNYIKKKKK